ncbi:MAG: NAD(P)-dependent oxidoreductase [Alphaproteobacteria bacterium]|jgi:3-hydroxyisobutyrate dehydrogenase|nr:NAD(P)-dependent oxidoreductase [Alphaproteobacteria bacterium]MBT7943199.1 NAD(P)-dependent oxidoreductase [Alphaproteobacteria bacterium]
MSKIAFIGTGNMGTAMAGRLIDAGHSVRVYNRSPAKAAPLTERGATIAATPGEAAHGAEAVFAMLSDDEASKAVWLGEDGALAGGMADNGFVVECSTLSHKWVLELAGAARNLGLRYIDSPVTGIPAQAEAGELTLLVGADEKDLTAARPLLAPLSQHIIRFGDVGAGTAYKLMVNLMGAVQIAGAAEGMALAEKAGLDARVVADALGRGAAASPQVIRTTQRIAEGGHDKNVIFSGKLRLKDVLYALELADTLGQQTPFGDTARDAFQRLVDAGYEELNETKIIDVLRS